MNTALELTRKLAKAFENAEMYIMGNVIAVDSMSATCTVQPFNDLSPEIEARLGNTGAGCVVTPSIDSYVVCCEISPTDWIVVMYGAIQSLTIDTGISSLVVDAQGVTVNGGNIGGLPISELVAARLAALEGYVNVIQAQYANLLTQLSSTYLPPLAATVATLALPPVVFSPTTPIDIENPKFKQ